MPNRELPRVLVDWNSTNRPFSEELTIHQAIERQAALHPARQAIVCDDVALSYFEFNAEANRLAHYLSRSAIGKNSVVGLYMRGLSHELMISVLAVLKTGAAYLVLDTHNPFERLKHMASDCGCALVLTQDGLQPLLPEGANIEVPFARNQSERRWKDESSENLTRPVRSLDLAYVIYTSGSTGQPKGVEISHRGVVNLVEAMIEAIPITGDEVIACITGLSWDLSVADIFPAWFSGAKLILIPPEKSKKSHGRSLRQMIENCAPTFLQTCPSKYRQLLDQGWTPPQGIKLLCGGEALPRKLLDDLIKFPVRIWNLYGPTETTVWSTLAEIKREDFSGGRGIISVGRPIANTQIYILDESLASVAIGDVGEVHIGGVGLSRGYRNLPSLTSEKFISNPFSSNVTDRLYKTGDMGRFLPTGELQLLGRKDDQIKILGSRIEPGEIEAALLRVTKAEECVVLLAGTAEPPVLVAFLGGCEELDLLDIAAQLSAILPRYIIPRRLFTLPQLPRNSNGKIDRTKLLELAANVAIKSS